MFKHLMRAAIVLAATSSAHAATTTTIDFEQQALGIVGMQLTVDDYSFQAGVPAVGGNPLGITNVTGSNAIVANGIGGVQGSGVTLSRTDGQTFNIQSVDVYPNFTFIPGQISIRFRTVSRTGEVTNFTRTLDPFQVGGPVSAARTVMDFSNFLPAKDIVSFHWDNSAFPFVLDNFVLLSPGGVPEPASWALMIGGFGLAGTALRRRAQANPMLA